MTMLKRKRVFAAKIETTPGTAETLAGADGAFNAYNVMAQANITMEEREGQGGFNYLSAVPGAYGGTLSFRTDLGWDGGATVPTWASVLFPACGWLDDSSTFKPKTESLASGSSVKSVTIACFMDGVKKFLAGAQGTFQMVLPAGRMGYIDWTFTGVWQDPTSTAMIAPTYPDATNVPLRFASATVSYTSDNLKVEQVTIDAGNNVILREDASTAAGYSTALITNRNPRISANPEFTTLSNPTTTFADWIAAGTGAFSIVLDGPSSSTLGISAPYAQIMNAQEGDRNGMVIHDIEWACLKNGTTTDEELQFIFTPA